MVAKGGTVELLQFAWPPAAAGQDTSACAAYVAKKRSSGFLLCIFEGFLILEELDEGHQASAAEGVGPHLSVTVSAVELSKAVVDCAFKRPPDLSCGGGFV